MLALPHRLFQFFLVISKQSVNLAVRFAADGVNPRTKLLARRFRIPIEQRLNPIMVLLKQRPYKLLLFRIQLQICRKASKLLVDRLWRMDMLKLLTREACCPLLSFAMAGLAIPTISIAPYANVKTPFRMDNSPFKNPRRDPSQDSHLDRRAFPRQGCVSTKIRCEWSS